MTHSMYYLNFFRNYSVLINKIKVVENSLKNSFTLFSSLLSKLKMEYKLFGTHSSHNIVKICVFNNFHISLQIKNK